MKRGVGYCSEGLQQQAPDGTWTATGKIARTSPGPCCWFLSDLQPVQPPSTDSNREDPQPSPAPQEGVPEVLASIDSLLAELEASQQAFAQQLQQAEQARDEQAARLQGLEGELAKLKGDRDAADQEKATAQQSTADLNQQLVAQAETLQQTQQARDEQAARVKDLDSELSALMAELDFEQRIKTVEEEAKQLETAYDFKIKT